MRTVETPIIINAEAWEVWDVLTKVYEYDNWNPTHKYINGMMRVNEFIEIEIAVDHKLIASYMPEREAAMFSNAPNKAAKKYRFQVLNFTENELLEWESKIFGGLFVHHKQYFELQSLQNNQTLFINHQKIGGLAASLMPNRIFKAYFTASNIAFNEALKFYVEEPVTTDFSR